MNSKTRYSRQVLLFGLLIFGLAACERPPVESTQQGFRGTGMVETTNPRLMAGILEGIEIPDPLPPVEPAGLTAGETYQNVQVLADLDVAEFNRFMAAITQWVSPEQGCAYCHADGNFAEDNVYTKVVSRKMIEMTQAINSTWSDHVGTTGVTCYTCHEGNNVPEQVWVTNPGGPRAGGFTASSAGQNAPAPAAGMSSLPYDPFTPYLLEDTNIRVGGTEALPDGVTLPATKQTEETFSFMVHISDALGVNCTFCHNSRDFSSWETSSPARLTAWHGIRMTRDVNNRFIEPLTSVFPQAQLGPLGDPSKVNCATCHQGVNKPLMGASMLQHHPELAGQQ